MNSLICRVPFGRLWRAVVLLGMVALPLHADIPYAPVMVYYDQTNSTDDSGRISANALRNLLGHFKTTVYATNVASYAPGDLPRYEAAFYVGSTYEPTNLPDAFLNDVAASTTTVVWLNYNLWLIPGFKSATNRFGIRYTDENIQTGYNTINYKGEWLYRRSSLDIVGVSVSNFVQVLATATNRTTHKMLIPYALRSSNFWYVADNPLREQLLADRSLVLADLLHDILGSGTNFSPRALARIEDIAPALTSNEAVTAVSAALRDWGVRATFGIIPRYRDPLGQYTNLYPADVRMSENRKFQRTLRTVLRNGGTFADHGYTHESGDAESGSGFEFWDSAHTNPLPYDSWAWCNGRVTNGLTELLTCGFPVTCWETPHYEASLVDYPVFSDTFRYSHERARVFGVFAETLDRTNLEAVSATDPPYTDQWFPYVIQRSVYGNTFLPENLDRYEPATNDNNGLFLTVSNKIDYARKFRVVRDGVAGFYYHPGRGIEPLTNLVSQMQSLGYTFSAPDDLARDEAVAIHTNDAWAASNTVRTFTATTNLLADLVVGDAGANNRVYITNGVTLANEGARVGIRPGSFSNIVFVVDTGSVWTCRRPLSVGQHGSTNYVVVWRGGCVQAPETTLGLYQESRGNIAAVQDAGSVWSNRYGFVVGQNSAENWLIVWMGGRVTGLYGEIGATTNAYNNAVAVMDPGSVWSNSQYVVIGNAGASNSLSVLSSGRVVNAFGFIGARSTASSNAVVVSGPGSGWTNTAGLMIGVDGRFNTLTISYGGNVSCASAVVGNYDNAGGNRIDIQGGGATLSVGQELTIGADGFDNVVRVGQGGVLQCGSMIVGRDDAGPGNQLIVDEGSVLAAGAVQVRIGRLSLVAGTLQANSMTIAEQGEVDIATDFDMAGTVVTNRGLMVLDPGAAVLQASIVLAGNGRLDVGTGSSLRIYGDFLSSSTNTAWSLATATLAFSTSATHRLSLGAVDRGAHLTGFSANQALGTLDVQGEVIVTNTVYAWALTGAGNLHISPGSRVYYATKDGWTGSVAEGTERLTQVPVTIDSIGLTPDSGMRLSWASASGLTFTVGWADDLLPESVFSNAASLFSVSSNQVWADIGDTNRPHPSVAPQRFYRIDARP